MSLLMFHEINLIHPLFYNILFSTSVFDVIDKAVIVERVVLWPLLFLHTSFFDTAMLP